jgi:type IV pilus assembly protein PilB
MRESIAKPQGAILVTGPTGSGKSSTLFAMLREVVGHPINIVTIENPIEYDLAGANQVQINDKTGLTFASTLRSILRQDPNVILVGEIRDKETAETAFQAAMTGHLVLSTLHTNDAPNTISRLGDLGVAPFLVASSLAAVVAQRLARRICADCRTSYRPDAAALAKLGLDPDRDYVRGAGCSSCGGSGYRGRTVVAEVLAVDARMREIIAERGSEGSIRRAMRAAGSASMAEDAAAKVRAGVTTVEEVLRVVEVPAAAPQCPGCSEGLEQDYMGCPRCGVVVRATCRACRQPLRADWAHCPYCTAQASSPRRAAAA